MEGRILKVPLPFGRNLATRDGYCSTFGAAAPAASALMRPAHELHGVFDMPPGSGHFDVAFSLELDGVLGSFRDGLGAMGFQELPCIVVDFDFSHGVILLSFCAQPLVLVEPRAVDVDTSSSGPSLHPAAAHLQDRFRVMRLPGSDDGSG
jgi:hypothetical protein